MLIIKIIIVEYLLRQPLSPPTLRAEGKGMGTNSEIELPSVFLLSHIEGDNN